MGYNSDEILKIIMWSNVKILSKFEINNILENEKIFSYPKVIKGHLKNSHLNYRKSKQINRTPASYKKIELWPFSILIIIINNNNM